MELPEHEAASQHRYEKLMTEVKKGHEMSDTPHIKNIFEPVNPMGYGGFGGAGAGGMAGAGAGVLGGILGGALLNNGGLFGRGNNMQECVTPTQLSSATASIIDSNQNTTLLQAVGDVKAAVPLAEGQVQLAIAGAVGEVRSHLGQVENTLVNGQANINNNIQAAIAASLASQNNLNVNILTQGSATRELVNSMGQANLSATKDSQFATQVAISNSTKEILAALTAQNEAGLRGEITALQIRLGEQQNEARARGTEVNVTQTVNQNQMQLQAQQQQQQLVNTVSSLCHLVGNLQNAVATNSNMIIGNTGAVGTGPQTANPVNVRA